MAAVGKEPHGWMMRGYAFLTTKERRQTFSGFSLGSVNHFRFAA